MALTRFVTALVPFRAWLFDCVRAARGLLNGACRSLSRLVRCPLPIRYWLIGCRKARCFERDTRQLLNELTMGGDDVVFIPNIDENEMLGLLQVLRRHPHAASASWHLLFRRNIYTGRPSQYVRQDEGLRQLRNQFRYFHEQANGARVFFYTDTEQLSEQYVRLGVGAFKSLPVPVAPDYRPEHRCGTDPRCVNIVYVGDAREEKGYHYLPRLVQDLWRDYLAPGRARCTFQSNYNTEAGEPPAVVSRSQLADYPGDKVRLLLQPLDPAAYRDLILGADVAVLPYDRDNYYARSSGVFTEALAAGVPVVVPAGSWMALQFARAVEEYHFRLLQDRDIQKQMVAGSDLGWRRLGGKAKFRLQDGVLPLGGQSANYCSLKVPDGAGHLLVRFRQDCNHAGEFVRVEVQSRPTGVKDFAVRSQAVVGGLAGEYASALLPLPHGDRIRVAFRCAFDPDAQALSGIEFHFLRAQAQLPLSAAGRTYDGPSQFSEAVREILANHRHYAATAADLSTTWSAYNHPATLVAALTKEEPIYGERGRPLGFSEVIEHRDLTRIRRAA